MLTLENNFSSNFPFLYVLIHSPRGENTLSSLPKNVVVRAEITRNRRIFKLLKRGGIKHDVVVGERNYKDLYGRRMPCRPVRL